MTTDYRKILLETADRYGIPRKIALNLVQAESSWNPAAVSPKGAIGLTQLMPGTAAELGVDPTDPVQNLEGGMRYLRQQYEDFGDWSKAVAAYNAGPSAVRNKNADTQYEETRNYVSRVMQDVDPADAAPLDPWVQKHVADSVRSGEMSEEEGRKYLPAEMLANAGLDPEGEDKTWYERLEAAAGDMEGLLGAMSSAPRAPRRLPTDIYEGRPNSGTRALRRFGIASLA